MKQKRKKKKKDRAPAGQRKRRRPLTLRKKLGFSLVTAAAFFVVVELALIVVGVKPVLSNTDPYVGFSNQVPLLTEHSDGGRTVVETAENKLRFFNHQSFNKEKTANSFRIFCLGGSTTYGRPFDDRTSFCGWLREFLTSASPETKWDVFNAGGISYASYRVVRVMEELSHYEPDLFIVYTGHNEFLEERTYRELKKTPGILREVGGMVARTRVYSVVHKMLRSTDTDATAPAGEDIHEEQPALEAEVRTRLDGGVGPDAYERDELLSNKVAEHFQFNLNRMVEIAQSCGAKIVFITPAANLADCSPFKSEFRDGFTAQSEWQNAFDEAQRQFEAERFSDALESIKAAVRLAPEHAATQYLRGRILQQLSSHDLAKEALVTARDEDVCPLRAISPIVSTVRQVCAASKTPFIDFEEIAASRSDHGIPGESLFLDHVHPTVEGHRIVALELFDWLCDSGTVEKPKDWASRVAQVASRVEAKIDRQTRGNALLNLSKVLAWAGKHDDADRLALQADGLLKNSAETVYLAGNALLKDRKVDEAIARYREALRIDPNFVLGLNSLGAACIQRGDLDEALTCFQRVVQLQPEFAPAHNNLGTLYQQRGEHELAMKHFDEAIRLNPRYSKAFNNGAVLLRVQKKYPEAEAYLQKSLAINPEFAEAHFNLGLTYQLQGKLDSAESEFQQAIRLDAEYLPATLGLGKLYEEQQKWLAAATLYQKNLRSAHPRMEVGQRAAWLMATCPNPKFRNGKGAIQIAAQLAKATKANHPEIISTLAAAYAETGDFQNAVKWQTEAVAKASPQTREIHQQRLDTLTAGRPIRYPR